MRVEPCNTIPDTALVLLTKAPELGKVKTRLAPFIGERQALNLYKALLKHSLDILLKTQLPLYIKVAGEGNLLFDLLPGKVNQKTCQSMPHYFIDKQLATADLGARIIHALEHVFKHHHKAIIVGGDCPTLSVDDIVTASQRLDTCDVCIAPAEDGGYVLLGINSLSIIPAYQTLFTDINWGTSSVFQQTLAKISDKGITLGKLSIQRDIDLPEDLLCWQLIQAQNMSVC